MSPMVQIADYLKGLPNGRRSCLLHLDHPARLKTMMSSPLKVSGLQLQKDHGDLAIAPVVSFLDFFVCENNRC